MRVKRKILILCTGNSARSQMAEGFFNSIGGGLFETYSAGIEPKGLNPMATAVMAEAGIDISGHTSDALTKYLDHAFDLVITVCDNANEKCPLFPGDYERIHWSFDDPARLDGDEDSKLALFRRVRDEIKEKIGAWVNTREKSNRQVRP